MPIEYFYYMKSDKKNTNTLISSQELPIVDQPKQDFPYSRKNRNQRKPGIKGNE